MISKNLQKARNYEETMEKEIEKQDRPSFHLSSRVGWMNDPNGFSYYKGMYHLFYQYHPYDTHWGPMHWGHAVSKDLLHWEHLPAALAPDEEVDKDGCFSGSAIEMEDGRHLIIYTGVRKEKQKDGEERDIQTQCIAIGDGLNYEKHTNNPVLTGKDIPKGGSIFDFRDPKIWREQDGKYFCVVGNCDENKDGQILLYSSENGIEWKFEKTLIINRERIGKMWECPDFFQLDGKNVLIISPQEVMPVGYERHNGNGTICFIGSGDKNFAEEKCQTIDYGIDFYAPQTVLAPDGRRIMIGWLQNWDTCNIYRNGQRWFGQMSIPRELTIKDGRLIQIPVRELEALRGEKVEYQNIRLNNQIKLEGIYGRKVDLELEIWPENKEMLYQSFAICFAQNERFYSSVSFHPHESIVEIDRTFSGTRSATIHQRRCPVRNENGRIKSRLILDKFSVELFVNDGEQALSATIYTDLAAEDISFVASGNVVMNVVKYELISEEI